MIENMDALTHTLCEDNNNNHFGIEYHSVTLAIIQNIHVPLRHYNEKLKSWKSLIQLFCREGRLKKCLKVFYC